MANAVPEKLHSELGASIAKRWMNCPGSVRLSRGLPNTSSPAAIEGTAAHALAELALRKNVDPTLWIGVALEGVTVDDEMAEFVRLYVDECRRIMGSADEWWIERRFNLAALRPAGPMFGTSDFSAYTRSTRTLDVVDLKYGRGVVVEVASNEQLRYYALGVALTLGPEQPIDVVRLTIVQPRAAHTDGVVRSETIAYEELIAFTTELLDAARKTTRPDAPLVPGPWCQFCPASGGCPAQLAAAQSVAMVEFDAMPIDVPPAPETLPASVLLDVLAKLPVLEEWASAVRAFAKARLERGEELAGFKLVAKRATRRWKDEDDAREYFRALGFTHDEIDQPAELKSPAQIEKLVGKKHLPSELIVSVSSGTNMVPDSHPSPAVVVTAGEVFGALPAPHSDD